MIDSCDKSLRGAEPERTVADRLDLIVHSLDGRVGKPDPTLTVMALVSRHIKGAA